MFPIKNGLKKEDALLPFLFNFALDYGIKRVQVNQDGLKLNGTRQLPVYVDYVNILGEGVDNVKKNTAALVVTSKETGLEVNADNSKYMVMSRGRNARRIRSLKIDNCCFEKVEEFKYLGTILTNQNSIQEEIMRKLKKRNACYHSVENLLSFSLLYNDVKITIYRTTILLVVLYGYETRSLT
jgi:hypothetical protein